VSHKVNFANSRMHWHRNSNSDSGVEKMRNIALILCIIAVLTVEVQAQENPKEFFYAPRSGDYAARFIITQKLLDAIANAKAQALSKGLNFGGFRDVSVSFESEKVVVRYFNLGTLDGPYGEVELSRPDFKVKSIR
jgi:hypothetical protein